MDIGNENVQLYHNTGVSGGAYVSPTIFNPWVNIARGTARYNRIGDKISPTGMLIRLWLANKLDRPNILYRVVVCVLPRMYSGAVVTGGSIDPGVTVNAGAVGNYLCLPWDKEKGIKVLYDRVISNEFKGGLVTTNKESHKLVKIWVKRKRSRPICYDRNEALVNNFMALYVIPYDSYGTLTTDNIASCAQFYRLYFKDL